ncbi:hypothetical protein [Paenibacillus beijingensis]|uniref:NAD-dependent epimerase/dehydratase domain-containing protein n=1 Tax=Paenibacillus beijingensis TaxID=1126833 RepID=A0A0D5NMA1_9BACL|nr:hypothetical protein [Paenibacillus beijingensis]AJY76275.1 hypothetical protein VN24_19050 [Paenibacillus beijingensis]
MYKVLILGGTRFVGKRLVEKLLVDDCEITIANRGITEDNFGNSVKRIIVNRWDYISMNHELGNNEWDIVYDFICFNAFDALDSCRVFKDKIGRYILISSQAVYSYSDVALAEADFDPSSYKINWRNRSDYEYSEGKKSAEAAFKQMSTFPVTYVRFPYILGKDDYSLRLDHYVKFISNDIPIGVTNLHSKLSLISSEEASQFLYLLLDRYDLEGPMNACSHDYITTEQFLFTISDALNKDFKISNIIDEYNKGPYDCERSWFMNNSFAIKEGFLFKNINDWLTELVLRK